MKNLSKILGLAAVVAATSLGGSQALAQDQQRPPGGGGGGGGGGRGNFDPAQMRQRMMERMREQLEVKDDAEWKVIETRIEKVTEARRDAGGFGGMGMMRGGGPGGPGGQGGRGRGGFGGAQLPEAEELQKAIDSKASADEIKGKMAKLREARKSKEAELEKAQDDLRKLLSVRQEAIAVVNGLLK